jgi:hypothetical protein
MQLFAVFRNTVQEYMRNTTIHGLNYIQKKTSFLVTRFVWTTLVAASLLAFTYYSLSIYTRWLEEPIVMNLDDKLAEIHEIPFPAVIICFDLPINNFYHNRFHRSQFVWKLNSQRSFCKTPEMHLRPTNRTTKG